MKLTGAVIQNLKPHADGRRVNYFDSQHKGLCLRVGKRDKTWTYHYRFNGKARSPALGKYAIGRTDHMDRSGAINEASTIDKLVDQGVDPKSARKLTQPKPTAINVNVFNLRVKQFLDFYQSRVKPETYSQAQRLLESRFVNSISHTDVGKVTRSQVVKLLEAMHSTPAQANRLQHQARVT